MKGSSELSDDSFSPSKRRVTARGRSEGRRGRLLAAEAQAGALQKELAAAREQQRQLDAEHSALTSASAYQEQLSCVLRVRGVPH